MRLRLGCELRYTFPQPTPLIAMLNVHPSRFGDLERPDRLVTNPVVPIESYRDMFGNWCCRLTAPAGGFAMGTDSIIRDDGRPDAFDATAVQHAVEDLPAEALPFLLPSRYCESDLLTGEAGRLFGHTAPDMSRVQAICDFVHHHLTFDYKTALPTRTAHLAYDGKIGVCRDFTHLAITFCRAMNIPAMYCTGYISDVGMPPPVPSMDFCAWMRVYLGGRWHDFDPRNNKPMIARVLCGAGRDAADVPLVHQFGWGALNVFKVWIDEIGGDPALVNGLDETVAGNPLKTWTAGIGR
ncbi:MAG: transglutaminase family protein [Alphaproteobacteria bacterium]|nr:transglutaminase family protein [Alphaproteobacteria bacterium]